MNVLFRSGSIAGTILLIVVVVVVIAPPRALAQIGQQQMNDNARRLQQNDPNEERLRMNDDARRMQQPCSS
jgi:uncharacterized protein HemX